MTKHVAQVDSNKDYDFAPTRVCFIHIYIYTHTHTYIHTYIHTYEISYCSELKFLAMNITDNLCWHINTCSLCASLNKIYYIIKSLKDVMSFQMIQMIYYAYFQSRMRYGGEVGLVKFSKNRKSYSINIWCKDL